jgi:hypothetical protein
MRWCAPIAIALALVGACREPTQLTLVLSTDARCSSPKATTSVSVAPSFDALPDAPGAIASTCTSPSGDIGTIVLVPSGDKSATVAIEIVAGVDREACAPRAKDTTGCIVARRRIRFAPHTELRLPIVLAARCAGVTCGPDQTCDASGACVSAECSDPSCANVAPPPPPPVDGGASIDGFVIDAPPVLDGPTLDVSDVCKLASQGVDCGPLPCLPGLVCCDGTCLAPTAPCSSGGRRECDEVGDCLPGQLCCAEQLANGALQTNCAFTCRNLAARTCHNDCDCIGDSACAPTPDCPVPTCGGFGCGP